MIQLINISIKTIFLISIFFSTYAYSNTLEKIQIVGNDRISEETIKLFINDQKEEIFEIQKID